nr:MAG TPA: hypothetical protein [Bacteriophage sp.]
MKEPVNGVTRCGKSLSCEVQILTHLLGQIMLSACRRSMFWLKYDACLLLCDNLMRSRTREIDLHGNI